METVNTTGTTVTPTTSNTPANATATSVFPWMVVVTHAAAAVGGLLIGGGGMYVMTRRAPKAAPVPIPAVQPSPQEGSNVVEFRSTGT